jgi:hypothetical protein
VDLPWLEVSPSIDYSADLMSIENQLTIGSCVSNTITSIAEMMVKQNRGTPEALSRLAHYYWARSLTPYTAPPNDLGMTMRQGLQAAKAYGLATEAIWPYDLRYTNTKPSEAAEISAAERKLVEYRRLKDTTWQDPSVTTRRIQEALMLGYGVYVGIRLAREFFYLQGPAFPYTYGGLSKAGAELVGGHAMPIAGCYIRGAKDWFKFANSWDTTWGDGGFANLATYVVCTDAMDIWAIKCFDGYEPLAPEVQQAGTFVSRLYVGMFGRAPDAEGLVYWRTRHLNGVPMAQIAEEMFSCAPARKYYPLSYSSEETVRSFYYNVLGRSPDAEGLAFWTAKVNEVGAGPAILEICWSAANYLGNDPAAAGYSDRYNRRVRAARLYGEGGGSIEGGEAALLYVN